MRTAILALALVAQASAFVAPFATGCGATLRGAPHAGARGMLTRSSPQLSRLSMVRDKTLLLWTPMINKGCAAWG